MNQLVTDGIILSRTNFGEADRIVKLLTPQSGKVSVLARGVRKQKSKLAGGIELFSISSITYIKGRGELGTLVSARLDKHYRHIVSHIDRVQLGYEIIKVLDRATEDEPESEYFDLLIQVFEALNDAMVAVAMVRFWFNTQLVRLSGHTPNLFTDSSGNNLDPAKAYSLDIDTMICSENPAGTITANHIKFLRLAFDGHSPKTLQQITGSETLLQTLTPLAQAILTSFVRV